MRSRGDSVRRASGRSPSCPRVGSRIPAWDSVGFRGASAPSRPGITRGYNGPMRPNRVRFRLRTLLFAVLISAAAVNAIVQPMRIRFVPLGPDTVMSEPAHEPFLSWGLLCLAVWAAVRARSAGRSKRPGN